MTRPAGRLPGGGSLTQLITDTGLLYQAHVRTTMLGVGYRPEGVQQAVGNGS